MPGIAGDASVEERARRALGEQCPDDYHLKPELHVSRLELPAANLLRDMLQSDPVSDVAKRYSKANAAAIEAQGRYKLAMRAALALRVLAIVIGACYLLQPQDDEITRAVQGDAAGSSTFLHPVLWAGTLFVLQALALGLSFVMLQVAARSDWYREWKERRGEAEAARVELFNTVLARAMALNASPNAGELPALPLALEYFRRYQLQVQRAFYDRRTKEAQQALSVKRSLLIMLIAFAAVAGLHGLVHQDRFPTNFASLDAATTWVSSGKAVVFAMMFATVYSGLQLGLDVNSQILFDRRNVIAYARMRDILVEVLADRQSVLTQVRRAAAQGDAKTIESFFANLQHYFIQEHGEWRLLREHMLEPQDLLKTFTSPVRTGLPE